MKQEEFVVITGSVTILRKGLLGRTSFAAKELLGKKVKVHLVSLVLDPGTQKGCASPSACLHPTGGVAKGGDTHVKVSFKVHGSFGKPGAIVVDSHHPTEFFLKSVTLDMPDGTQIYFPCHSWITHSKFNCGQPRAFFTNEVYLPSETPAALKKLREEELLVLRGNGGKEERKFGERIYEYDVYNDLCEIDKDISNARPILGGTLEYPYPRRCRTGRARSKADPAYEIHVSGIDDTYIPRDERFSPLKKSLFLYYGRRSFFHDIWFSSILRKSQKDKSFKTFDEIHSLYSGSLMDGAPQRQPNDISFFAYYPPAIVQDNKEGWKTDYEFGRQRLAGANPFAIERLKVFPPVSALDPKLYGDPTSCLTTRHLEPYLEGLTVEEALNSKQLYILDYHDLYLPYLNKVNETHRKTYASRTIFYLTKDGMLLPIAIELSLPPKTKDDKAARRVFTPNRSLGFDWVWHFAKAHVTILDMFYQLSVSHWLRTHCTMEPFIMSTRRHLSRMHPLHVFLAPHFKDTMNLNASGRTVLVCSDGRIERNFALGNFSMEITSAVYKHQWQFDEQALPKDLLRRGVAVEDPSAKTGVKLTIEDYPFAADGLELWWAIHQWAKDYMALYYKNDKALQEDAEVQSWWSEIQNVGHGDHAGAVWWADMKKVEELVEVVSTLIWVSSGLHAAVNFGQYAYGGYMPNSPSMARRFIPEEGTPEYEEMMVNPEKFYLDMVPNQGVTTITMSMFESLASHVEDEEYLGQRMDPQWTSDGRALVALETFQRNIAEAESIIEARNAAAPKLLHRCGPVKLPYTLLTPSSGGIGITLRGVPNSISM